MTKKSSCAIVPRGGGVRRALALACLCLAACGGRVIADPGQGGAPDAAPGLTAEPAPALTSPGSRVPCSDASPVGCPGPSDECHAVVCDGWVCSEAQIEGCQVCDPRRCAVPRGCDAYCDGATCAYTCGSGGSGGSGGGT